MDDLFARLLQELEDKGQLDNTVIIGVTDHYTYGYKDEASLYALSGVDDALLLEKDALLHLERGFAAHEGGQDAEHL